jgi:predicted dehydrogenase
VDKSGDTLVEKCCHFFDLFRLITQQEVRTSTAKVHRGLLSEEYGYDKRTDEPIPIIDSAYVLMDFQDRLTHDASTTTTTTTTTSCSNNSSRFSAQQGTLGCLELCMFADGSRHQEEIVVTGLKGRVEAYLPENKVFHYLRPKRNCVHEGVGNHHNGDNRDAWVDLTQPPPRSSIKEEIIDCSNLLNVYSFANEIPQHAGHHYCSTAVEWKFLIDQVENW